MSGLGCRWRIWVQHEGSRLQMEDAGSRMLIQMGDAG